MTTTKNVRASFSSSSGALLTLPYGQTNGETQKLDPDTAAYTVADPPYLASQVGRISREFNAKIFFIL